MENKEIEKGISVKKVSYYKVFLWALFNRIRDDIDDDNDKVPKAELVLPDPEDFGEGDYVTRDGSDIHFVEKYDDNWGNMRVVCIIAPSTDWTKPGEYEDNLVTKYCRCNRHFLPFAKKEHEKLKKMFPNGWVCGY